MTKTIGHGAKVAALAAAGALAAALLCAEQPAPTALKVFISADMEGVGGVSTWTVQANSKGREYEKFRVLMTKEVNAAVAGAFDAGATEVVVGDSHGDAQNIDVELLDKRVRLIRAWPRPLGMMQGVDASFGAVVFVGYHAAEGRAAATLSHSFSGTIEVELDGVPVPEAGFNAAIAGDFGVPVVFLSGDQTICADAKKLLGPIETAVVKEATGFYSASMMHPEEAQKLIREGVRRGVERRHEIPPYRVARPVTLRIRYNEIVLAEVVAMLPGVERPEGNVIVFRGRDMVEVSKFFEAISNIRIQ
ncbi:MAG: M55 family metallopeptidase [Syntrophomonadaceae bacterium]